MFIDFLESKWPPGRECLSPIADPFPDLASGGRWPWAHVERAECIGDRGGARGGRYGV